MEFYLRLRQADQVCGVRRMSDARTVIADELSVYTTNKMDRICCAENIIAALAEAGLRIVPEIPSDEMFKAASEFDENSYDGATKVWRAMVEAANEQ
jgi:hypothetical protein